MQLFHFCLRDPGNGGMWYGIVIEPALGWAHQSDPGIPVYAGTGVFPWPPGPESLDPVGASLRL